MKLMATLVGGAMTLAAALPLAAQAPAASAQSKEATKVATTRRATPRKENLKSVAKISKDSARTIALSKVAAGSKVRSSELEREKGTVVYSFDIKVPKQAGVEEILVSAIDGSIVSQTHESPKQEKAEAAKEKKEAKKP